MAAIEIHQAVSINDLFNFHRFQ